VRDNEQLLTVLQPPAQLSQAGQFVEPFVQLSCIDPDVSTISKNQGLTWTWALALDVPSAKATRSVVALNQAAATAATHRGSRLRGTAFR
jgi:hypothetical protein